MVKSMSKNVLVLSDGLYGYQQPIIGSASNEVENVFDFPLPGWAFLVINRSFLTIRANCFVKGGKIKREKTQCCAQTVAAENSFDFPLQKIGKIFTEMKGNLSWKTKKS